MTTRDWFSRGIMAVLAVGMGGSGIAILCLLPVMGGCYSRAFVLSDESAVDRLVATKYVADLQKRIPVKFICWVEGSTPDERDLYLGEDHDDHTVRLRACRVTADGRVWVNADDTLLNDHWVVIE